MKYFCRCLSIAIGIGMFLLISPHPGIAKDHLPEGTLTSKELKPLISGTTAEMLFGKSSKGLRYFDPNGELLQVKRDRLKKGKWKIKKNDRLCTKFGNSSWDCRILVLEGDVYQQYVVKKSGNHERELTYKKFHPGQKLAELNRSPLLPDGTLTRKKLEKLFSGKTVESKTVNKGRVSLSYYDPSGTVEQLRNGVLRFGTWRVSKKDRICLKMEASREKCRIVVKEDGQYNKYIVKKSGQHQRTVNYLNFFEGKQF